jgi:ribonuclease HII
MTRERQPRPTVEALLSYDLAVCAWLEADSHFGIETEGGEIPFEKVPALGARGPSHPGLTLAGFDEAGRGALAGPVVVACVRLDLRSIEERPWTCDLVEGLRGIDDSKRLSPRRRADLFARITERAAWGVGSSPAADIDRMGIVAACRLAAVRAYRNLGTEVDVGLFDRGLSLRRPGDPPQEAIARPIEATSTGADGRSLHVAAASIVAKVSRDRIMCRLDEAFSGYGLARHKGYGTPAHREAIGALGPSRIHRRTFLKGCESTKSQSC